MKLLTLALVTSPHVAIRAAHAARVNDGAVDAARLFLKFGMAADAIVVAAVDSEAAFNEMYRLRDPKKLDAELPKLELAVNLGTSLSLEMAKKGKQNQIDLHLVPHVSSSGDAALARGNAILSKIQQVLTRRNTAIETINAEVVKAKKIIAGAAGRNGHGQPLLGRLLNAGPQMLDALLKSTRAAQETACPDALIIEAREATTGIRAILHHHGKI